MADMILHNGRITTFDPDTPEVEAIAISSSRIEATGTTADIMALADADTKVIDLQGQRVIPGLIDSHTHIIRQGNNFAMELRWDTVPSLADGLAMLKRQAERTPAGQWIRVVGGWSADQFAEKRLPTIDEINAVSGDVPVYVLHLYDRAWLNKAALRALGIDRHFYEPFVSGRLERDDNGNPTGLALARPNAQPLYALLDMAPKLDFEQQITSTKHYFRALNGLGLTSALDCAGGFLNYPDDYGVISELNRRGEQIVRIGYQLFAQRPLFELDDFKRWNDIVKPDEGDEYLKCVGAGEMLVASAYDFEDFSYPRPELPKRMEGDLRPVLEFLFESRWPIRFHCTYEESAHRLLSLVEEVGRDKGLHELNWIFDHGETLSERTMEWVAQLGGGISYQNRIAFQATAYRNRYGEAALRDVMPVRKMMASGVPLAAGTDATRVSSYNPWLAIHWAVSGKGRGGDVIWAEANRLSRTEALHHWTAAGAWFSREQGLKGQLKAGQLADIAVLDRDYFAVAEEDIADITADLTLTGGKIVHAKDRFAAHAPAPLPQLPDWSPIPIFGAPGAPSKIFLEPEPVNWKPNAVLLALATALTVPAIGPAVAQDVTRYEGWIEAKETAVVSTQLDGVVAEILFVGGERVEPGEPLILLDPFGAEIALAAARAQRDAAKAQLTGAEQEANRAAQLTTRGVASAARRDATETDRAAAAAQVAAAEAVLRRAERDMERTVIRAPIAGHISRPTVAVGAFVEAESGSPLAAIVALDPVLVAYAVPYAARLDTLRQAGANTVSELHDKITLTIELPGGSTYAQTTRPSFASAQVDPTTGAVTVWAEVANPDTLLRPGMAVTVRSALGETPR